MKLETAKELKRVADEFVVELPNSTHFYTNLFSNDFRLVDDTIMDSPGVGVYGFNELNLWAEECDEVIRCHTTDELLGWLPSNTRLYKNTGTAYVATQGIMRGDKVAEYSDRYFYGSPSEALAFLAIELIKNKVIK